MQYVGSPVQFSDSRRRALPVPVFHLFVRLCNLFSLESLDVSLRAVEVSEAKTSSSSISITISIQLCGWLESKVLVQQMKDAFQEYNRKLAAVGLPSLQLFAGSSPSCVEQQGAQRTHLLASNSLMGISLSFLPQERRLLQITLQQHASNMKALMGMVQDILEIFFTGYPGENEWRRGEDFSVEDAPLLTERELEILAYVSQGFSNREIAQKCCIAEGTVKRHMNNIYSKLQVKSRTQAVACAQSLKLLA